MMAELLLMSVFLTLFLVDMKSNLSRSSSETTGFSLMTYATII